MAVALEMPAPIRTYNKILKYLYVSGCMAAQDLELLKELGITRVIVIRIKNLKIKSPAVKYLHYAYQDEYGEGLDERFDEIAHTIEVERLAGGTTMVCCQQGRSRSIAAILAYLIKYTDHNLKRAYAYVRSCRPCMQVNEYFLIKLAEYEYRVRKVRSVRPCYVNGVFCLDSD